MDRFYDLLVPFILIALLWAIRQCWLVVRRNGARIYLNSFGLFLLCYAAVIYLCNFLEFIPDASLTFWMRPLNFAIFLLLGSLF